MTVWVQIKTDNHWSNHKSYKLGDQSEVGTAVYNAAEESWTLPASKRYYYLTERGGWNDGFAPRQMKVSFEGSDTLRVGINQKGANPGTLTAIMNFESSGIPQPATRNPNYGDLWYLYIDTENVEIKITNIAFSLEEPAFPYEGDPGFVDSELTEIETSDDELTDPSYTVFNGTPYYCGMMLEPVPSWQGQRYQRGVYKKYEDGEWVAAEESEIYRNLAHSVYGSVTSDYVEENSLDYWWESTESGRELFVISHGDQYKSIYTIDEEEIISNWEGSYFPDDRLFNYTTPTDLLQHKTLLDSQNQFWVFYTVNDAPLYEREYRVLRFFHLDDDRGEHAFDGCLIVKETGSEYIHDFDVAIDSEDVVHIVYEYREYVGASTYYKHIYCKDNTWSSPQTITESGGIAGLLVGPDDTLHLITSITRDRWIYNGSSWSLAESGIPAFYSVSPYYRSNFVMDPWDHIHQVITYNRAGYVAYGQPGYSVLAKISNEKGYWTLTKLADMPDDPISRLEYSAYGIKLFCDSDGTLHCFFSLYQDDHPTTHYITGSVLTSQILNSSSSTSVSSQSSSSSEESKSSESSVSSTSSQSSESDSSESSSSESKASKSSSSESLSSSSESKASKSSSSESSSLSSHSSQSWGLPCGSTSGNVAACPHWSWNYGCTTWHGGVWEPCPWPKYSSDSTSYNPYPGIESGAPWNGTEEEPSGDFSWYILGELEFDGNQYVEVELEYARAVVKIKYVGPTLTYISRSMTDFDLVASNTGNFSGEEAVLKRVRGLSLSLDKQEFNYSIKNNTAYKYYRIIPWGTQNPYTPGQYHYCRFNRVELYECYDDSSSSSESSSSDSSISESSFSAPSTSSASAGLIGLYQLCNNTNVSSSSSSESESSYSMQEPDITWP
jgi:hypothetical protein